jgi:anti-sigma-K factor RskA
VQASAWNAGRHAVAAAPVVDLTAARRQRERKPVAGSNPTPAWWRSTSAGWAAAAALAVAFVIAQRAPDATRSPPVVAVESQRNALLDQATDLVTVPWGPSGEPGYENASGDVVWSNARQEGYLRIRGLPINDRAQAQYQLWIVDASRDVHPVDGGVFDITINGELIIPVRAKLPLNRPGAFAVTLEKPGGVVVSDGPMLLVAAVQT